MVNRLGRATSPYLLQHAANPVDWWEWKPEAFAEAAERDVPVLLSVGYASCHWCHVMAHESFEDETTAATMNRRFVNIKVDREERPDIDRIYMDAVQAMTGHGGWPMTVFLTPDGLPFFAGTYFPKMDRHGHPSFSRVMDAVHDAWLNRRDEVSSQAGSVAAALTATQHVGDTLPGTTALSNAYETLESAFDATNGGFGGAPKFPQAPVLEFLLRSSGKEWAPRATTMLETTLTKMADGGIHDHVAGGFSRYSVDNRWLVPHFEKMLYDNALLARLYARAWQVTGVGRFADVARSTLDYMERDLGLTVGGFASGEDADSEGEEGRFYVFTLQEIAAAGGSPAVAEVLGVTEAGNFEGRNIVHRSRPTAEVAARHGMNAVTLEKEVGATLRHLAQVRNGRVRPGLDDKVVCAWNALAVRSFAEAGSALGETRYVEAAQRTARFLLGELRGPGGRLMRSWRDDRTSGPAFCDDYAALALGLFAVYQATGDAEWFAAAELTTRQMIELFWDDADGGFFAVGNDVDQLIMRPKNVFDNPTPSDNALAAEAIQHLAAYTGDTDLHAKLDGTFLNAAGTIERYPLGAGHLLSVLQVSLRPPIELAIVGFPTQRHPFEAVVHSSFRPHVFVAVGDGTTDHGIPLLVDRPAPGGAVAYVCRGFVCDAPLAAPEELARAL